MKRKNKDNKIKEGLMYLVESLKANTALTVLDITNDDLNKRV